MKKVLIPAVFLLFSILSYGAQFKIGNGDVAALKAAITASNSNASPDTIHLFPYSRYILNTIDNNFIFANNALPRIELDGIQENTLTIMGNGAKLILDTAALDDCRLLFLTSGTQKIYDLGFMNGRAEYYNDDGGAVYSANSTTEFYNCLFLGNTSFRGGAIYVSAGNLLVDNCTFAHNDAMFMGGAVCNFSGVVKIQRSTLVYNTCYNASSAGALFNQSALNSPSSLVTYVSNSIVALNTVNNPSSADNGKEVDLAENTAVYSWAINVIGCYSNTTVGNNAFVVGAPTGSFDYVGPMEAPIDPLIDTFARHTDYQETFSVQTGSVAKIYYAGNVINTNPAIASIGLVPSVALEGTEIIIYGKNFNHIISVQFEGLSELYTGFTKTDTSITVTVPVGALSGKIKVTDYNYITAASEQVFIVGEEPVDDGDDDDNDDGEVTSIAASETKEDFHIYPNPVLDKLTLDANGKQFSILDVYGKELLVFYGNEIDLSKLAKGMYVLKCDDTSKRFAKE